MEIAQEKFPNGTTGMAKKKKGGNIGKPEPRPQERRSPKANLLGGYILDE